MSPLAPVLCGLSLLLASSLALAGDFEVQAGITSSKDVGDTGAVWVQSVGLSDPLGKSGRWQKEGVGSVGYLGDRDESGYHDSVWLVGLGQRIRHLNPEGVASHWFVEGQVLGAVGRTPGISGPIQFGTALGWSGDRYQVLVRHVSNAGLREPNHGETMLLLGVSF